jgi:hypothetical protein
MVRIEGEYEACLVDEATGRWGPPLFRKRNLFAFGWGGIITQLLAGNLAFKVAAGYLEYKNVVNGTDPVPVPVYDRTSGLAYFNGLPANQDFLRVPLVGLPAIDTTTDYLPYFTPGVNGNRVTFKLQTTGTVGVLGLPFSNTVNSKLFGLTLVATPLFADRTQDLILSRGYFGVPDQQLKQVGSQLGVNWRIAFR